MLEYIRAIRERDPGLGGSKLWYMYRRDFEGNNPVGRDRFADIVDRHNLKVRLRVRKPRTTDSTHGLPTYPNIVKDLWVDAYHYVHCFLSLILDAYTEEIVGWSVGPTLSTQYPVEALRMALKRIEGAESVSLIHHSDRGCQYASSEYIQLLKDHNIRISMTETGDPKDNAQAERINNTMKNELLKGMKFTCIEEVITAVSRAADFYNNERPHMSINMMTPAGISFRATPSSQSLTGIRPGQTTKNRDNDDKSTHISYKLNQSQLLSGIDSSRSQPKSGNDRF